VKETLAPGATLYGVVAVTETVTGAEDTTTCISSIAVAPSLSVTLKRKTYVPDEVILENEGDRVALLPMLGVEGPETKDHTVLETVPIGVSVAEVPVGALVEVGRVIALSGPALATGGMLAQVLVEVLQVLPGVQLEVTLMPAPAGGVGTSDLALL
jgi:hypothetical protein